MFTTPAPPAPTVSVAAQVSPTSTSIAHLRPSRLRDLSASFRSYRNSTASSSSSSTSAQAHPAHRATAATTPTTPLLSPPLGFPPLPPPRLSRTVSAPDTTLLPLLPAAPSPLPSSPTAPARMTRNRADTAAPTLSVRNHSGPTPTMRGGSTPPDPAMDAEGDARRDASSNGVSKPSLPSIRLIPHQDPRPGRPSLQFSTMSRTLPNESAVIRVGRYSERDNALDVSSNVPSDAPVGFKSKVVSRKHCELWCKDTQWYIKDVKSSSGTFLNRIRLSQPNEESKPFKIKDGDIVQLGIDFRGGEEMIFRCVKIRVECNRGWQQGLNTFNKQTHQRLRNLAKKKESDASSSHTSECSICLMSIAPCQSLFVAPCSHVWHYKCIRPILNGATWPNFLCPNCRAVADLEADAEDPGEYEEWDDVAEASAAVANGTGSEEDQLTPQASNAPMVNAPNESSLADLAAAFSTYSIAESVNAIANQSNPGPSIPDRDPRVDDPRVDLAAAYSTYSIPDRDRIVDLAAAYSAYSMAEPVNAIANQPNPGPSMPDRDLRLFVDSVPNNGQLVVNHAERGPMTPRNNAGPFILDGNAGRESGDPNNGQLVVNNAERGPMTPRNNAGPFILDGNAGRESGD